MQGRGPEALAGHHKYQKVRGRESREPQRSELKPASSSATLFPSQIRDLNSGTFGFVQLALDKTTGRQVAIKFIERGDKVCGRRSGSGSRGRPGWSARPS